MARPIADLLDRSLAPRLSGPAAAFARDALGECARAPSSARFGELFSLASRHARGALAPSAEERASFASALTGLEIERWSLLETLRVRLAVAVADAGGPAGDATLDEAFRFADDGEQRALLRAAALLPRPAAFRWRVGEGCRSNLRTVFEAAACDTPYLRDHFDAASFHQAAIKALFVGAPLWRIVGLDARIDADLARMALDLADERRSAGRHVAPELWLCLGAHGGERAIASLERELLAGPAPEGAGPEHAPRARAAVGAAFVRAGERARAERLAESERDPRVVRFLAAALGGARAASTFRALEPDTFAAS